MSILCGIAIGAQRRIAVPIGPIPPAPKQKATPTIMIALPNYDELTATRLQIFLDNSDFGPGKIDGKMGEFFRKALVSYKHAHATRETGFIDQWMLDQVPVTFTTYTIKGDDLAYVGWELPDRVALGYVEGWRGEIFHWIHTAPDNRLARCKIKDPSLQNWPAITEAILGNIIPDFPVVNKSFNFSYSGTDR